MSKAKASPKTALEQTRRLTSATAAEIQTLLDELHVDQKSANRQDAKKTSTKKSSTKKKLPSAEVKDAQSKQPPIDGFLNAQTNAISPRFSRLVCTCAKFEPGLRGGSANITSALDLLQFVGDHLKLVPGFDTAQRLKAVVVADPGGDMFDSQIARTYHGTGVSQGLYDMLGLANKGHNWNIAPSACIFNRSSATMLGRPVITNFNAAHPSSLPVHLLHVNVPAVPASGDLDPFFREIDATIFNIFFMLENQWHPTGGEDPQGICVVIPLFPSILAVARNEPFLQRFVDIFLTSLVKELVSFKAYKFDVIVTFPACGGNSLIALSNACTKIEELKAKQTEISFCSVRQDGDERLSLATCALYK